MVFWQLFLENFLRNKIKLQGYFFVIGVVIFVVLISFDHGQVANYTREIWEERITRIALSSIYKAPLREYQLCVLRSYDNSCIPPSFIIAILATENYGRPPLRRRLEEFIAKISLFLAGKLPNISLGVGQILPSTAKMVLGSKVIDVQRITYNDAQILELLLEPCENIKIIRKYLTILMHEQDATEFDSLTVSSILRIYNGQSKASFQNEFYVQVVWKIFSILEAKYRISDERLTREIKVWCK